MRIEFFSEQSLRKYKFLLFSSFFGENKSANNYAFLFFLVDENGNIPDPEFLAIDVLEMPKELDMMNCGIIEESKDREAKKKMSFFFFFFKSSAFMHSKCQGKAWKILLLFVSAKKSPRPSGVGNCVGKEKNG